MEKYINELMYLLNMKSPSGHTEEAMIYLEKRFLELGLNCKRNRKGALVAQLEGINKQEEVTLAAHIDTLGAMVKDIDADGKIRLSQIGGYAWSTIEGEYVDIETMSGIFYSGTVLIDYESSHVHGIKTSTEQRKQNNLYIRLDEIIHSKEDVLDLGINIGDYIHFDPRSQYTDSGFIKSRHLDNKAGVVALLAVAEHLVKHDIIPNNTTNFFISNYEEVGHGASTGIPSNSIELIAVDMAAIGEGQSSDEYSVTICAKDSSGPYDYELRKKLVNSAENEHINYKIDIYPYYGSDGSAALKAGADMRVALIGPGVHASHSYERMHEQALEQTIKLIAAYLTD